MQEKIDWAKLHYLGKELLELENNVAKEVFVNEKFDPKKYRKLDTMRSLSVSMGKNSKIKASLNLKEKVEALSAIEQEELIRLLIVQSGLEENEFFNPVVLSFIEDNLFSINDEYCKILGKGIYKDYLSEYAEKLIAKNNLKIITKSPEKIINSENFIFSNILNAVSSLKINWGVNGLLKDRYNFNNRDKYLNGKKVMNNLIDFILENSNFKAIYDKTLWINKYKEFFDNASVEELNIFAERIEKVLTTPIKEKYIYFLKIY